MSVFFIIWSQVGQQVNTSICHPHIDSSSSSMLFIFPLTRWVPMQLPTWCVLGSVQQVPLPLGELNQCEMWSMPNTSTQNQPALGIKPLTFFISRPMPYPLGQVLLLKYHKCLLSTFHFMQSLLSSKYSTFNINRNLIWLFLNDEFKMNTFISSSASGHLSLWDNSLQTGWSECTTYKQKNMFLFKYQSQLWILSRQLNK